MKTLSERFTELRDDTFAEIKRQMARIGHDITEEDEHEFSLEFLSFSSINELRIRGINKDGDFILDKEIVRLYDAWCDGGIGVNDLISLAEELQEFETVSGLNIQ
jgi:hypothetical protein